MSEVTDDVKVLGGIVSDLFDGKTSISQSGSRLEALGATVGGQIKTEVGIIEKALGPQATAAINTGIQDIQLAAGGAITILDADIAPYLAQGAKVVEGAFDAVLDAAVPGGAALNGLVNSGIDAIANGLKAAIDAQALARKAAIVGSTSVAAG